VIVSRARTRRSGAEGGRADEGDDWWKWAIHIRRAEIAVALGDRRRALQTLADQIQDGMPLYGNLHLERSAPQFEALRGHPAYPALTRAR
jgi:hypothetical protein